MTRTLTILIGIAAVLAVGMPNVADAATEQAKQAAIDAGLAWLAGSQTSSGSEGYWSYPNDGTLAATGAAALAFIGEGYLPGDGSAYGATVQKACNYILNRATDATVTPASLGAQGLWFDPGPYPAAYNRSVYTTGICTPVVYELGKALGPGSTISMGSGAVSGLTYKQAMQGVMDWFTWGQNPDGGWQYSPNTGSSDNSTAQWGALPYLYGNGLGLSTPASVTAGLEAWTNTVQNTINGDWRDGGSGYSNMNQYVNMAKTGGMLLEFAVQGKTLAHSDVQNALFYMDSMIGFDHWNQGAVNELSLGVNGQWYGGNLNNPYAMWAVFKGLETYGGLVVNDNGTPGDPSDDFLVGSTGLISTAPGGFTIGQDWGTQTSAAGDWYSHYSDYLVNIQNADGSWTGYGSPDWYWTGPLATAWYINILNATGAPPPVYVIPEPLTMVCVFTGVAGLAGYLRKRRRA